MLTMVDLSAGVFLRPRRISLRGWMRVGVCGVVIGGTRYMCVDDD